MKQVKTKYGIIVQSNEPGKIDFNKSVFNYPSDKNFINFLMDKEAIQQVINN